MTRNPSSLNYRPAAGDPSSIAGRAFQGAINTIGAPGVFPPRCSAEDRAGGSPSVRPVATFDSAGDCNPRAVTFSDCNLSHKAADNIANALNSSRPFVSVLHANKHGEIECAKTRPGWTGK